MSTLLEQIRGIVDFASPFLERLSSISEGLGLILVFFLPGFAWTLIPLAVHHLIRLIRKREGSTGDNSRRSFLIRAIHV